MNLKPRIPSKKSSYSKIDYRAPGAADDLATQIYNLLPRKHGQTLVVVCIGTDRSTGDAFGPLIGSKLAEKPQPACHVFGTLAHPVHAVNLEEEMAQLQKKFPAPYIIGIDASLGRTNSVGNISLGRGPVKPGAGVHKQLPSVGDVHLTGIVNVSGFMEYFVLQNTRLHLVAEMADVVADSLHTSCLRWKAELEAKKVIRPQKVTPAALPVIREHD